MAFHVCELLKDRIIALTEEGRRESNFVVLVVVRVFAVFGVLDFVHDLVVLVDRLQLGLGERVVFAGRKGFKYVLESFGT